MVELNHRDRTIKVKLVYYGPPLGGKTTNLQILHHRAEGHRRGELISVNSAQDRTVLFDLLPLKTPGFRGFDLRLQVLAVPGQAMYAATRRLVLKGADSLVFVANSALDRWEENLQSYREMTQNLLAHGLDPAQMPLVLQYNKRDLPQVLEPEALDRGLNSRNTDAIPAVAIRGEGVLETFIAVLALTVHDLAQRYAIFDVRKGRPARQWAEDTVKELFGATRLSFEPDPALMMEGAPSPGSSSGPWAAPLTPVGAPPAALRAPAGGHTVVRVAPTSLPATDEGARPSRTSPDARSTELVETYAEASAQLGAALAELREERDAARQRLADLRHSMEAAQRILSGAPLESALEPVLEKMARIAGTDHAALWVPQPGSLPRGGALLGLSRDPLLEAAPAARHVLDHVGLGQKPSYVYGADDADLGQALDASEGHFVAVLAVPFRTPAGLQGLGLFYYDADTAQPGAGVLEHLAEIPRALSAALELAATLHTVKAAERALELALTGTASLKGLGDVVRSMEALRDGLRSIRNRPDAPSWFVEQFTGLAPALSAALTDGRSLLAFAEGKINRESVYVEDLLSELHTSEVTSQLDPSVQTVLADATLLRVALRAMTDELRARAGANATGIVIRTRSDGDKVRVSLRLASTSAEPPAGGAVNAGIGLGLARRIAELHGGALDDSTNQLTLALPVS
jgi:signal recognition particle receptor subunit beta